MARTFSARWDADVLNRLERESERLDVPKSRLAERYVDEGLRMDAHPGIVFRDGPAGRRAALAAGPDVWQLVQTISTVDARGEAAIAATADLLALAEFEIRIALRYYADFPEDVDERIRRNVEEADAAEAAWRRAQGPLA